MRNKAKTIYVCDPAKNYICSKGKSCQDWCFHTEHAEFMKDGTKGFTSSDPEKRAAAMAAYISTVKKENADD